jgi:hypothetical protein
VSLRGRGRRASWPSSALALALLVAAPPLLAQAPGTPQPQTSPAPSTAADERYHEAFALLARGDRTGAAARLRELVEAEPGHPLAARARGLLAALAEGGATSSETASPATPAAVMPSGREERSGAARAELTLFQTLHGAVLGAEVCVMAGCEEARPWVLSLMLGAGLGFGTSFVLSEGGVRPGLSRALSDGALFGAANGLWLLLAAEQGDASEETVAAYLAIGQLAGLGVGGLIYHQLQPTTGQVSLAASGGIWLPVTSLELAGAFGAEIDDQAFGTLMLVATNGGLALGGWLASEVPVTASRALLIDGGGLLGTLAGFGLGVLAQGDEADSEPTLAAGFAGTVTGLIVSYVLTQSWDPPTSAQTPSLRFSAAPAADGGFSAQLGGTW